MPIAGPTNLRKSYAPPKPGTCATLPTPIVLPQTELWQSTLNWLSLQHKKYDVTRYLYRTLCLLLAFAIGVAATCITIAVRHRFRNNPTNSSNKKESQRLPGAAPRRVWPEPRRLDLELIDADRLAYSGYLVKRLYKTVKVDDWQEGRERPTTLEMSYATLIHNGKVLARFDDGLYHPMGNSTAFDLSSLLGGYTKQLVVVQSIWRVGSYWIVNLAPRFQVVYRSGEWGVTSEAIYAVDLDDDGVDEIVQPVTAFYALQDKVAISQIPLPEVIFKYDTRAAKYLPANTLHKNYLLREIEESTQKIREASKNSFDHLADVLNVALRFVYAGEEREGWALYDKVYQLPDKEEVRSRVLAVLKDEPVYQFIYKKHRPVKPDAMVTLPARIKSILDGRFPGWTYLPVDDEIRKFLKEYVSEYARPDLINGDFDGNGRTDYAVLIEENARSPKRADREMRKDRLVVFLTKVAGFEIKVLDPEGAYLAVMKQGDWDYSYETNQYFTYQNDAIFAGIFEKGGTTYVYEKGRFRSIITSD